MTMYEVAGETSALSYSLHPHQFFLAQPGGALVSRTHHEALATGNFTGVSELVAAIKDYLAQNNKQPKPFVWTATAQQIIEKVNRCKGISETLH